MASGHHRKSLPVAQGSKKLSVTLPATAPEEIASVLCVETATDSPMMVDLKILLQRHPQMEILQTT
jgi:hypothetical protein